MSDKYPFKSLHRRSFERVSKSYGLNRIANVSFDEETGSIVLSSKEIESKNHARCLTEKK